MDLAPGEGLDGHVEVVGAGAGDLQHGGGGEARAAVAVVLHLDLRVALLDAGDDQAELRRTADAGHVLEADLVCAVLHELVHQLEIIFHRVHGGVRDGEGGLGNHAGLLRVFDGKLEVARIVQTAEGAGNVGALRLLDLEHQFAHVRGHGIHTQGVEAALQHMGLDAGLVEGGRPLADGDVRVFAVKEVHLLERAAVGLDAVEATHVNDSRSHSN